MKFSAERWAIELTHLLNAALGPEHFPINVPQLALDYSRQRFPADPILDVLGDDLPGFDGALYRATRKPGWKIIYNSEIGSPGRINFTLAHELGHYLLHRIDHPNGFECGPQQVARWDSAHGQLENQANNFAACLLMPLDDYRRILPADADPDLDRLGECADRYNVSLIAATLRWLSFTARRAVLVVSRDGYILWSRASTPALRSGKFFRTSGSPVEVPALSIAANPYELVAGRGEAYHAAGVWFDEPVREMAIHAEQYDFTISLLKLEDMPGREAVESEDVETDVFSRLSPGRSRRFAG